MLTVRITRPVNHPLHVTNSGHARVTRSQVLDTLLAGVPETSYYVLFVCAVYAEFWSKDLTIFEQ